MVRIIRIRNPLSLSPFLENHFLALVNPQTRERVQRFHFSKDRCAALLGEVLVRRIISSESRIPNDAIHFKTNSYGKPFWKDHPDFQFNISHSGEWIAAAAGTKPLGIDVEKIHTIDLAIAERFFSNEEKDYILSQDNPVLKLHEFFKIWTLKESVIKALGKGLSCKLSSFSVWQKPDGSVQYNSNFFHPPLFFRCFSMDDYFLSLCSFENDLPSIWETWEIEDLISPPDCLSPSSAGLLPGMDAVKMG